MDPLHDGPDQGPADRFDLILRPESPTNPFGLEEEIAAIIRQKVASLVRQPPAEWTEPDPAERSPKAVAVEARVFHAIDEISTENAGRVAERDRPRPHRAVGFVARLLVWCLRLLRRGHQPTPQVPDVAAARQRIEAAVEQCYHDGIIAGAEVTTAAPALTDQPAE